MKLLIIQPWFCAIGHPAQSLVNMASAIGRDERVEYLVSSTGDSGIFVDSMEQLKAWGKVETFIVESPTGELNTTKALWALLRMRLKGHKYQRIFFFDGSLLMLALLWPLFSLLLPVKRISLLYLQGPEVFNQCSWRTKLMIKRFLMRRDVNFYLRTEELAKAWTNAYKGIEKNIRISTLPSLEIPDGSIRQHVLPQTDQVRFGVIGQIRPGKSLDWLVPVFQKYPVIGKLTVAGDFFNQASHAQLSFLDTFEGFVNCFMSEDEMLERASMQDYLLMLYDGSWDKRMESAILYLAARVNRPVIVYGDSWCGRMVREFGCGVVAPVDHKEAVDLLRRVPRPGSAEYAKLLEGMDAFRHAHSVKSLRAKVLQALLD